MARDANGKSPQKAFSLRFNTFMYVSPHTAEHMLNFVFLGVLALFLLQCHKFKIANDLHNELLKLAHWERFDVRTLRAYYFHSSSSPSMGVRKTCQSRSNKHLHYAFQCHTAHKVYVKICEWTSYSRSKWWQWNAKFVQQNVNYMHTPHTQRIIVAVIGVTCLSKLISELCCCFLFDYFVFFFFGCLSSFVVVVIRLVVVAVLNFCVHTISTRNFITPLAPLMYSWKQCVAHMWYFQWWTIFFNYIDLIGDIVQILIMKTAKPYINTGECSHLRESF